VVNIRAFLIDGPIMMDLIYIGVVVLFFVVSGWYVSACDKM
jgi:fucose 4-O-acetylase-like acetyltransferase